MYNTVDFLDWFLLSDRLEAEDIWIQNSRRFSFKCFPFCERYFFLATPPLAAVGILLFFGSIFRFKWVLGSFGVGFRASQCFTSGCLHRCFRGLFFFMFLGGVRVTRLLLGVVCGVPVRFGWFLHCRRASFAVLASFASHLVRWSAIVATKNSYQKNFPQKMSRVVY